MFLSVVQCLPRTSIPHPDGPVLLLSADNHYVTIVSATPAPVPDKLKDVTKLHYVARQPIFDRDRKVFGYELLFRDGLENAFTGTDADAASRATLDNSLLIGLDTLCDGRRAFVNCTRDTLIKGLVTLLPSQSTVVEVLESVPADPDVMAVCKRLKEAGYLIALDDYVTDDPREPLTQMADIIKVDMKLTTLAQRADLIKRFGQWRCRVLAEKVETQEEFVGTRTPDQGRSIDLLPAAPIPEFLRVRIQERNPLGAARSFDSWRAGSTSLGPAGRGCGSWPG